MLKRRDVAALLGIEECIAAVERAFKLHGEGNTLPTGILGIPAQDSGFHIKAGAWQLAEYGGDRIKHIAEAVSESSDS